METYIDLIKAMSIMDKSEQFVIASVMNSWKQGESTGKVFIKVTDMTRSNANKFIKGSKSLIAKGILNRVARSHYMLHPKGLPPRDKELDMEIWEAM